MKKIIILISIFSGLNLAGKENPVGDYATQSMGGRVMAGCAQPRSSRELWINNVRTIIYTGGDKEKDSADSFNFLLPVFFSIF